MNVWSLFRVELFLRCPVGAQIAFVVKLKRHCTCSYSPGKAPGFMALISEDETKVQNLIILE